MDKKTKKVIVGSGIAIAGIAGIAATRAISRSITNAMVQIALDREVPQTMIPVDKTIEKIAGSEKYQPFLNHVTEFAEKLEQGDCVTVETTAHDGIKLIGHWRTALKAKRTIIAMHGWRSSWAKDFGTIADFWYENDCNVLFVEQRGQGDSGGDYMGFGLLERYDCLAWCKWINEQCGTELPLYLVGVSMGATTVLMATALELPENVRGIAADCGFTSPDAIWKHVVKNNVHMVYSIREATANDLCKKRINMSAKSYSTVDALKECRVPVMFIHGTEDTFVPIEMTYENYMTCASKKRLLVFPGADHGMSYYTDKNTYEQAVLQFWNDYDKQEQAPPQPKDRETTACHENN